MSITRIRIRKREQPYVQIDKTMLNDKRISYRAKGLHAYLLSKPDSWVVHIKQLEKESPREGRDAIASAIKELEIAGYVARNKLRNANGQLVGWETVVYETPDLAESLDMSESTPRTDNPVSVPPPRTGKPTSAEPKSAEPKSANPHLVIKDSSHNREVVKTDIKPPLSPPQNGGGAQHRGDRSRHRRRGETVRTHGPTLDPLKEWREDKKREMEACTPQTSMSSPPSLPS